MGTLLRGASVFADTEELATELTSGGVNISSTKKSGELLETAAAEKLITVSVNKSLTATTNTANNAIIPVTNATNSAVNGLAGNDVIFVTSGSGNVLNGAGGNDIILARGGKDNTLNGDEGSDIIYATGEEGSKLNGGTGNDIIVARESNASVLKGGVGNDTLVLKDLQANARYTIDNTEFGATDRDILSLSQYSKNDFEYAFNEAGDLQLTHANGAVITVEGWNEHQLSRVIFKDGIAKSSDFMEYINNTESAELEVIQNFMRTLDATKEVGFDAVDTAVRACSGGKYDSLAALVAEFKENLILNSGSKYSNEQKTFLKEYCGIDLDNADTGAISGKDAGGSKIKTAESVVPETYDVNTLLANYAPEGTIYAKDFTNLINGEGGDITYDNFYYATTNSVTFYWSEDNWSDLGVNTNVLKQIVSAVVNVWADASLDLINQSYDMSFDEEGSTLEALNDGIGAIQIIFENNPDSNNLAYVTSMFTYLSNKPNITTSTNEVLVINTAYYHDEITDINGNSSSESAGYLDRTIAHEMVHGVMAANVNAFGDLPLFIKEGLAELVHGVDDQRAYEILKLTDTSFEGYLGDGTVVGIDWLIGDVLNLTEANYSAGNDSYAAGYMLLRYLAKQVAEDDNYGSGVIEGSEELETGMTILRDGTYEVGEGCESIVFKGSGWTANINGLTSDVHLDFSAYKKNGMNTALYIDARENGTLVINILDVTDWDNKAQLGSIRLENYTFEDAMDIYRGLLAQEKNRYMSYGDIGDNDRQYWLTDFSIYEAYWSISGVWNVTGEFTNTEFYGGYGDDRYNITGYSNSIDDDGGNDSYNIKGYYNGISDFDGTDCYTYDWKAINGKDTGISALIGRNGNNDTLKLTNVALDDLTFKLVDDTNLHIEGKDNSMINLAGWTDKGISNIIVENNGEQVTLTYDEIVERCVTIVREITLTEAQTYDVIGTEEFIDIEIEEYGWEITLNNYNGACISFGKNGALDNADECKYYYDAYKQEDDLIVKYHGYDNAGNQFILGTVIVKDYLSLELEKISYSSHYFNVFGDSGDWNMDFNIEDNGDWIMNFYIEYYNHFIANSEDNAVIQYTGNDIDRFNNYGTNCTIEVTGNGNTLSGYMWNNKESNDTFSVVGNDNRIDDREGNEFYYITGNNNFVWDDAGNDEYYICGNQFSVNDWEGQDTYTIDWNGLSSTDNRIGNAVDYSIGGGVYELHTSETDIVLNNVSASDLKFGDKGLIYTDDGRGFKVGVWNTITVKYGDTTTVLKYDDIMSVSSSKNLVSTSTTGAALLASAELSFTDASIAGSTDMTSTSDSDKEQLLKVAGSF